MNEDYTKLKDFALEHRDDSCKNGNDYDVRYWVGYIDGLNALRRTGKTAEALEKQIPKKPIKYKDEIVCPSCKTLVGSPPYCRYCGQALDWGEEE